MVVKKEDQFSSKNNKLQCQGKYKKTFPTTQRLLRRSIDYFQNDS